TSPESAVAHDVSRPTASNATAVFLSSFRTIFPGSKRNDSRVSSEPTSVVAGDFRAADGHCFHTEHCVNSGPGASIFLGIEISGNQITRAASAVCGAWKMPCSTTAAELMVSTRPGKEEGKTTSSGREHTAERLRTASR